MLKLVKFFDETEDISRIMSAPNMPTSSLTSSPTHQSGSQGDAMDYESMFNSFNTALTSPFTSATNQSPFTKAQTLAVSSTNLSIGTIEFGTRAISFE